MCPGEDEQVLKTMRAVGGNMDTSRYTMSAKYDPFNTLRKFITTLGKSVYKTSLDISCGSFDSKVVNYPDYMGCRSANIDDHASGT